MYKDSYGNGKDPASYLEDFDTHRCSVAQLNFARIADCRLHTSLVIVAYVYVFER